MGGGGEGAAAAFACFKIHLYNINFDLSLYNHSDLHPRHKHLLAKRSQRCRVGSLFIMSFLLG